MLPGAGRRPAGRAAGPRARRRRPCGSGRLRRSRCSGPDLRRRAGVQRVVASTHGHEVGWSMLPGARQALRRIGATPTSSPSSRATPAAGSPPRSGPTRRWSRCRPGVDADAVPPGPAGPRRAAPPLRPRRRAGGRLRVAAGRRARDRTRWSGRCRRSGPRVPGTRLLLVGDGPDARRLRGLADAHGVAEHVVFTGAVPAAELPAHHAVGDVFALPCRTRGGGLDVEGLGIVAAGGGGRGLPVVAGDSGGAPETVLDGEHRARRRTAATPPRSPTPSPACWPIRTGRGGWAPPGREWMRARLGVPGPGAAAAGSARRRAGVPGSARPGARQAGWLTPA